MQVLLHKKTGRNEICPCQPTQKRTITGKNGQPITFTTFKPGGKKFKNCHGIPPVQRKTIYVYTNGELNRLRFKGQIGIMGI